MSTITVTVAATRGSTPREPGARMEVHADSITGTIGGGALEWDAIREARAMLATGETRARRTIPLGPDLGQCCGGAVTLEFVAGRVSDPEGAPIWIWGAGHVGRALAAVLAPLDLSVTLIDTHPARLPDPLPPRVTPLVAADMPRAVVHAPQTAQHFIMTYSHDIDLELCDALLGHGFAGCGLIGSATKWARFRKRLGQMGHPPAQILSITCPIGDPTLGKHPQAIAISVAARQLNAMGRRADICAATGMA